MAEPKTDKQDYSADLETVTKNFESAEDATRDSRMEAEQARDYFDGIQWTAEEIATLEARKQPVITDNMLKDKIEFILGLEASGRADPRAFPRTPQDEESAEAATDALRYVAENNDLDTIVSDIAENMFIEGSGGGEVIVERTKKEIVITIMRDRWDRKYYDPHSMEKDFSDARFLGTCVWMDLEDAKAKWPKVEWAGIDESIRTAGGDTYDDTPKTKWYDNTRQRVRVVEQWYRKGGEWYSCKFVRDAFVESPKPSPYKNSDGDTEHPYAWMSAYVDRDGNRYGVVRRFKSLQDEVNHRRSRALFILNSNQIIAEEGAVLDKVKARKEANKPDGYIETNQGFDFRIEKNTELALGQAQLLQDARQSLSTTSPSIAAGSSSQSGRAKQIDGQKDAIEMGRLFDQLRALKREIYTKIWNRVQQFWTDEKWVRIRDDEGRAQFVQLNQPVTALEHARGLMEQGDPMAEQALMLATQNPNEVVEKRNNVTELDVDIIIDESPDVMTLQGEQFAELVNLAQAGVLFPPDVYLEASNLRNKDSLLEKLKGGDDPEQQAAMQQQQQLAMQQQAIEMAKEQAEIEKDKAKARKDNADATEQELKNMVGQSAVTQLAQE